MIASQTTESLDVGPTTTAASTTANAIQVSLLSFNSEAYIMFLHQNISAGIRESGVAFIIIIIIKYLSCSAIGSIANYVFLLCSLPPWRIRSSLNASVLDSSIVGCICVSILCRRAVYVSRMWPLKKD